MRLHIIDKSGNSIVMHDIHIAHIDKTLSAIDDGNTITFYITKEITIPITDIKITYKKPEEKNGSLSD